MAKDKDLVIDKAESQIVERAEAPIQHVSAEPSIMQVIEGAVRAGRSVEELSGLFALYERTEDRKAKAAFNKAIAAFKAERPPIVRRSQNAQFKKVTRDGRTVPRNYAALEDIERAIGPTMAKHGLSYGWGDAKVENGYMTIPCIVTHEDGHSISSMSMPFPIESKAGASDQQKMGIAQSYAMRYSLKAALGLTDIDEDDTDADGDDAEKITENQAANLQAALDSVTTDKARQAKFRERFKVETLADLPLTRYGEALAAIEKARKS